MGETLKELEEKVKRIKLEKQLTKLGVKKVAKKRTQKIKSYETGNREELQKLAKERQELVGKIGVAKKKTKGFFGKVGLHLRGGAALGRINREIREKQKLLRMKGAVKGLRTERELEEEKAKLRKLREKSRLNIEDLNKPIQPIKTEDIFGY